jgi:hypothetical protein
MCRPTSLGGNYLATKKACMGLFYSLTEVTIGDREKTGFLSAPWNDGNIPKNHCTFYFSPPRKKISDSSEGHPRHACILGSLE